MRATPFGFKPLTSNTSVNEITSKSGTSAKALSHVDKQPCLTSLSSEVTCKQKARGVVDAGLPLGRDVLVQTVAGQSTFYQHPLTSSTH